MFISPNTNDKWQKEIYEKKGSEFIRLILNTVMIPIAIIVVAVPEGLPIAGNVAVAFSIDQIVDDKVLPKNLKSIENIGSIEILCMDNTGILTNRDMKVTRIHNGIEHVKACTNKRESMMMDYQ